MTIYPVKKPEKERSEREYGIVTVGGKPYKVFRTSPLFGDSGYGAVTINGQTFTVYRANKEDGDIGYGVVDVKQKAKKKPIRFQSQLPKDLAEIVNVWSELPDDIKTKVEQLIKNKNKG